MVQNHHSALSLKPPQSCLRLDINFLRETAALHRRNMSFIGGLAASPDPSNDVVFDHVQEDQDPHQLLLKDAWHAVHHFDESRNSTDLEDESQQVYSSFDFSHRDLYSLPAELASIISEHAVRLALNHNNLTGLSDLGPCMGDFTTLNYLVLKNNQIQEFPRDVSIFVLCYAGALAGG